MKRIVFSIVITLMVSLGYAQTQTYESGECLKFRIHYGIFNASFAEVGVRDTTLNGRPVYHVEGHGESTGLLDAFYKVDDTYESYIDKDTQLPLKFIRDINEGGHKKNKQIYFDHDSNSARVEDLRAETKESYKLDNDVQDMISSFYYIRNQIGDELKEVGDTLTVDMFLDDKDYKFKTVYLADETVTTKFGKVKAMKLRPYVQSGRVFKEKESLTVWISKDKNRIPVKIKAKLAVGSIKVDLHEFKGLKHSFKTKE